MSSNHGDGTANGGTYSDGPELALAGRPTIRSGQLPLDDGPVLEVVARGRRAEADCRARGPELDALHGDVLARVAVADEQQALPLEVLRVAETVRVDHPARKVGEPLQGRHPVGHREVAVAADHAVEDMLAALLADASLPEQLSNATHLQQRECATMLAVLSPDDSRWAMAFCLILMITYYPDACLCL